MATVVLSARFKRSYKKLTAEQRAAVDDALRKFMENPRHPGLHFKQLGGLTYRTIRYGDGPRIILSGGESGHFELVDVGPHSLMERYGRGKR